MGREIETDDRDLNVEVRRHSVVLSDGCDPEEVELPRDHHLWLCQRAGHPSYGSIEVSKEWLGKLLDFWTPERRRQHKV